MLRKVISGGQTGADRIGLEAAKIAEYETGGTSAKGWWTENGKDITLKEYGLIECKKFGYPPRTKKNVVDSDGTVLFGNMSSCGSHETIKYCEEYNKPHIENPTFMELVSFINQHNIEILNVAGNRGSRLTNERKTQIFDVLLAAFKNLK